ncbi:hypothetical protein UK14_13365 [Streptomyces sp. NRRL F-4428]|nr:hypothetical protein UK14_13365 [Streptomyces sp. NRRL F-4428]
MEGPASELEAGDEGQYEDHRAGQPARHPLLAAGRRGPGRRRAGADGARRRGGIGGPGRRRARRRRGRRAWPRSRFRFGAGGDGCGAGRVLIGRTWRRQCVPDGCGLVGRLFGGSHAAKSGPPAGRAAKGAPPPRPHPLGASAQ